MDQSKQYSTQMLTNPASPIFQSMVQDIVGVTQRAGEMILSIYHSPNGFTQTDKIDNSPVTEADFASDKMIRQALEALTPEIPILSEESLIDFEVRKSWTIYWLVDPLDGTKEFIKRNGEFTVNIALIYHGRPILGVIHAPEKGCTYWGFNHQAFKSEDGQVLPIKPKTQNPIRISVSRSHKCTKIEALLTELPAYEVVTVGSSLKFCWIAEGKIQYYPRANSISLWDIAAGEAILLAAGAHMTDWEGDLIDYTPSESYAAPPFKAWYGEVNG